MSAAGEARFRPAVPGRRARRRLLVCVTLGLAIGLLGAATQRLGWFATAQRRGTDWLFAARGPVDARAAVLVGIDQRSHRTLLPRYGAMIDWPRTLYARAVDRLVEADARVVVLDILFDAPRPDDGELAAAIRRSGRVVLPVEAQGPERLTPAPGVAQAFDAFVGPPPLLRSAAAAEGHVNVTTDRDSVVRSIPLVLRARGEDVPALALAAVARFVRRPAILDDPPDPGFVYAAGRAIPLVDGGRMLVNYLGAPGSARRAGAIPLVSFVDVVDGTFDPARVRDRLVFLGLAIPGLDEFATPTTAETRMWGVELVAHAAETVLQDRYLVPLSPGATTATIVGLALLAALLVGIFRPLAAGLGLLALLITGPIAAAVAFDQGRTASLVHPSLVVVLAAGAGLLYRVVAERAEQRLLRDVMARYLSPAVTRWVLREPERLNLGGETRVMTVLFSDLRDFTTLSHRLDPQTLVALLNEYTGAMTEIVFRHDGVLDKYIGDAIMAFWGAPMDQPDHARRACRTALDMLERLAELRAGWVRRGLPALDLGIGINTGPMVVGNMGSRVRVDYTVLGDAVNVASRLEGLSKEYGTRLVVGEATRLAAGEAFAYRFLDVVAVKGRAEPLRVYELLGPAAGLDEPARARLARYQAAMDLYRGRRWGQARDAFAALSAEAPDDGPSALYVRRSEALLTEPPPAEWDGVFVARSK
jgi:adenylate cyclase